MSSQNIELGQSASTMSKVLLFAGIMLVAANLRTAITGVGPLMDMISKGTGLSFTMEGLLTTLPLLAFAAFSPLAPMIARKIGIERTLGASLLVLTLGILLRYIPLQLTLLAGMLFAGVGIAMGNVLLPGLIKRDFPSQVGLMTGMYTLFMSGWAAVSSGISVPLANIQGIGWQGSLACWAILSVIGLLVWLPQLRKRHVPRQAKGVGTLWKSLLAWQVTFFMGLQSFLFYVNVAWLPSLLQSRGMSVVMAGFMLSLMQIVSLAASFIVPVVADKLRDQRGLIVSIVILFLIGYIGLLSGINTLDWLWVVFIGLAGGGSISLALALFGLRSQTADEAAKLSGMAQSIGYLLAAIGPILIGFLHDVTGAWQVPLIVLVASVLLMLITGIGAGRNAYVIAS